MNSMEYKDLSGCSINESISIYNCDCMDLLKQTPDNYYSLAIVDPPYGCIKENTEFKRRGMKVLNWDVIPSDDYFNQLFRVSKNVIIWGANYFKIPIPKSVIVWDKKNYSPLYGDAELAYFYGKLIGMRTSGINMGGVKIFSKNNVDLKKIHPTQKPVKLYEWILSRYAEPNQKILDTHLGSGSIAIAIDNVNKIEKMNLTLTACELDTDYFKAADRKSVV